VGGFNSLGEDDGRGVGTGEAPADVFAGGLSEGIWASGGANGGGAGNESPAEFEPPMLSVGVPLKGSPRDGAALAKAGSGFDVPKDCSESTLFRDSDR
jgi:hypothetical protein